MVEALHEAGIEVILDVVYNHTAEGNETGPTYSLRGIDNTTYYLLEQDRARYRNDSGTGNVVHTANRYVGGLILDSLRYWAGEMQVDGFRFDLASLFTRRIDGSIDLERAADHRRDPVRSDPVADCRLIAEAWDMSSYQLGRTFPGISWLQWNGQFRDELRRFVRGDPGQAGRPDDAALRQQRSLPGHAGGRLPPLPERQLRDLARRLLPLRPAVLQRQAQRGERARQPRRHRRQLLLEPRLGGRRRARRRRCWRCGAGRPRT